MCTEPAQEPTGGAGRRAVRIALLGAACWTAALSAPGARAEESGGANAPLVAQWEASLLESQPLSPEERVDTARSVLRNERWARAERVHKRGVEAIWRLFRGFSLTRGWSGVRRTAKAIWRFNDRGVAEDVALGWLEPGLGGDPTNPQLLALYERLSARERRQLVDTRLQGAEEALTAGRLPFARVLLTRSLQLDPGSRRAQRRWSELEEKERVAASEEPSWPALASQDWELGLSEDLLLGDYTSVVAGAPNNPDGEFVRAAAQLMLGERDAALKSFAHIQPRGGSLGLLAASWRENPEVDVDGQLQRAVRGYRSKKILGWIGGNALSDRGTSLHAWRNSLTPMNMAFSLPARLLRGWRPDGTPVREAALRYLQLKPSGAHAASARRWLDQVGWQDPERVDELSAERNLTGAGFQLPPAHTAYTRLAVAPVIVSRRAIESGLLAGSLPLRTALEGVSAVWLEARPPDAEDLDDFTVFTAAQARRLIDDLARGFERGGLRASLVNPNTTLERLRRLDAAVAEGRVLVAEPWTPPSSQMWSSFWSTLVDGAEHSGSVNMQRGDDDVVITRSVADGLRGCPRGMLCFDRDGARTALYGYADVGSGMGLGFQSEAPLLGALSLGMTTGGPEASLVLPLGRWLGVDTWFPMRAEFSVSPDSFYLGPVLYRRSCTEDRDSDEDDPPELVPLGVRSRCVLRLY